jgi:hypothetical protein
MVECSTVVQGNLSLVHFLVCAPTSLVLIVYRRKRAIQNEDHFVDDLARICLSKAILYRFLSAALC